MVWHRELGPAGVVGTGAGLGQPGCAAAATAAAVSGAVPVYSQWHINCILFASPTCITVSIQFPIYFV